MRSFLVGVSFVLPAVLACGDPGDAANAEADEGADGHGTDDPTADASTSAPAGTTATGGDAPAPGCKRGVAYGHHSLADLGALSPAVSWWYNWSPRPEDAVADGYAELGAEFVPMIWGGEFDGAVIDAELVDDATALLGFNEPNFFAQANLSPEQAAMRWPQLEAIADAHGLRLLSPAVNFCGGGCWETDPFAYLDAFFAACDDCRVDAIAAHWYACDAPALQWYLGELAHYGKPIWLTEFACGDADDRSLEVQLDYMAAAIDVLEHDPNVERYAWFSGRTDAIPNVDLLGDDGQLTALGELYVAAPANDACTDG